MADLLRRRASAWQEWMAGLALMGSVQRWWRLRDSIDSADYDERAFHSWIPVQRWWHRQRRRVVMWMASGKGLTLDVGCGSSVILSSLKHAVGLDISMAKLRFAKKWSLPLVQASAHRMPFRDESFDCVVCSQVIEHIPMDRQPLEELVRVLKMRGTLVVGTPDYATFSWRLLEPLYARLSPGGYKDEHITHFTQQSLIRILQWLGCRVDATRCTLGELYIMATKVGSGRRRLDEPSLRKAGVTSTTP